MSKWTADQLEDLRLWEDWKKNGESRDKLRPLLNRIEPLIRTKANVYSTVQGIPQSAIKAEFKINAVKGLKNYNPGYNVPISHHVMRQMDAAKRFVHTYQNIARIPEHRIKQIGPFKAAFSDLENTLRRPPTSHELSDKLKWPVKEVERMTKELRDDLLPWKGGGVENAFDRYTPKEREVLSLLPYELNADEMAVFEYTYGYGGKPQLGTTEMSKALHYSPAKVSRIKSNVAEKARQYLGG